MTLTDTNLRYLLAIYHLAKTMPEVTPLAVAQAMGVTKPSVTSILSCLMKHDVIVRKRYGKVYLTDRGVLYARYYDDLLQKILQHFPLEGDLPPKKRKMPPWPWPPLCPHGKWMPAVRCCTVNKHRATPHNSRLTA